MRQKNAAASNHRELMLAATYASVVKELDSNINPSVILDAINSQFQSDFNLSELLQFLDSNNFHEDFEMESRKHKFISYAR